MASRTRVMSRSPSPAAPDAVAVDGSGTWAVIAPAAVRARFARSCRRRTSPSSPSSGPGLPVTVEEALPDSAVVTADRWLCRCGPGAGDGARPKTYGGMDSAAAKRRNTAISVSGVMPRSYRDT